MHGKWIWNFWAKHYPNLWAQRYSLGPSRDLVRARIRHELPETRRILDAGCAVGQLLTELEAERRDLELFGFDPSPAMVDRARALHPESRVRFRVGTLESEPDGPFDLVTMCHAFPYVPDYTAAARRLFDLVRPGGHLFLMQANTEGLYDRLFLPFVKMTTSRCRYHPVAELDRLFTGAGFELVEREPLRQHRWMPSIILCDYRRSGGDAPGPHTSDEDETGASA